ncbi:hypothetical protein GDO78_010147 [Eleutherodactylus coqui]|uniref:Uncharacterized protein n=1 Tax=Eleutherodactylus coqui TaxID=57060 RepID=A0A8J6K8G5_ELECQ|nr:hypothetical protein GDO78_010147 [Eleutherodactylus coqui]
MYPDKNASDCTRKSQRWLRVICLSTAFFCPGRGGKAPEEKGIQADEVLENPSGGIHSYQWVTDRSQWEWASMHDTSVFTHIINGLFLSTYCACKNM